MNSPSNVSDFPAGPRAFASSPAPETRPLYWSIRRELWEHRSIWIAPLVVEGLFLVGFLLSTITFPRRMSAALALNEAQQRATISMPFSAASFLMILTAFLVGIVYCLDSLNGERRDRSILFWKSLPVSDQTTVLAKASIPLIVLPLYVSTIALAAHIAILLLSSAALAANRSTFALFWSHITFFQSSFAFLYGVAVVVLWHAPIYTWFLLVSGWAKRAAFLWAVLPLLAIAAVERVAFNTMYFMTMLGYRVTGGIQQAFVFPPKGTKVAVDPLAHLTPGKYLSTPGLWIGLLLAAAFVIAAIRLRRSREPI